MGQPVVHFEITGKDSNKLNRYYSELFGWEIDSNNPMSYGIIQREGNVNADGVGIGGGIATGPKGWRKSGAEMTLPGRTSSGAGSSAQAATKAASCGGG